MNSQQDRRYQDGVTLMRQVMGEEGVQGLLQVGEQAPELARWAIEAFGDVYGNTILDLRTRELVTVAALTALGNARPQLQSHIRGALVAGATPEEIIAVISQMYAYAGFPAALNGMDAAHEVFRVR